MGVAKNGQDLLLCSVDLGRTWNTFGGTPSVEHLRSNTGLPPSMNPESRIRQWPSLKTRHLFLVLLGCASSTPLTYIRHTPGFPHAVHLSPCCPSGLAERFLSFDRVAVAPPGQRSRRRTHEESQQDKVFEAPRGCLYRKKCRLLIHKPSI